MPSSNFAYSAAVTVLAGAVSTGTLGSPFMTGIGPVTVNGKFTGTALDIWVWAGVTPPFAAVIDGGAPFTVTPSGSGFTQTPVVSGLSDAVHTYSITVKDFVRTDVLFTVTGAAPAVSAPDSLYPAIWVNSPSYANYIKQDGVFTNSPHGAGSYRLGRKVNYVRFRATLTGFGVYAYDAAQKYLLYIDGVAQSVVTHAPMTLTTASYKLFTGLDDTTEHLYELALVSGTHYIYSIMPIGGAIGQTTVLADRESDAYYGDSIEDNALLNDGSEFYGHLHSRAQGRVAVTAGTGAAALLTYGRDNTAQVTGMSPLPTRIFCKYGTNDADATGLQAGAETLLANMKSGAPAATVYQLKLLPETGFAPKNAALVAAAAAQSVTVIDETVGIVIGTHTSDGRHPNAAGSIVMANNLNAFFAATPVVTPVRPRRQTRNKTLLRM